MTFPLRRVLRELARRANLEEALPGRSISRIGIAAVMLFALLAGERGLIRLTGLMIGKRAIRNDIVRLQERQASLEQELSRYTSDEETIERVAREQLDLVRPGETVYKFPADKR